MSSNVKIVDCQSLPVGFPTHKHDTEFWECLGRTIATFGFLEEMLGRAIFKFTGMQQVEEGADICAAIETWTRQLESALTDTLNRLITAYVAAVRAHPAARKEDLDALADDLRKAATLRNVLAHASWRLPDAKGRSKALYVDRNLRVFDSFVDIEFLKATQKGTAELAVAVINSVTSLGWQFPGMEERMEVSQ